MLQRMGVTGAPTPTGEVPSMTLGEYLAKAGSVLRTGIPKAWVEAVVLDARTTNVGLSIELTEPTFSESHDGRSAARREGRLRGLIWTKTKAAIEASIAVSLDPALLKGAFIKVLIETDFHPRYHLEGKVLALDPAVVQGLVQRRIELIRQQLREQGHWGRQRNLSAPTDVTSIAVIHPDRSAGWADVQGELEKLQAQGILSLQSYPVPFEGNRAANGITDALGMISTAALPDLVMIVRGGGAASGLAELANLALARAVCVCPVPIVTGIGHASDRSILDDCAWRAADTPSKALGLVKTILRQHCIAGCEAKCAIVATTAFTIATTLEPLLRNGRDALIEATGKITAEQLGRCRDLAHGIERFLIAFRGTLDLSQAQLERVAADLVATTPTVPRRAGLELATLHAGLLHAASRRLPGQETLLARAQTASGLVAAFVARQESTLRTALAAMESAMRRRLGVEAARLAAAGEAVRALDLDVAFSRGFVLPLDNERRIIRSAVAAQSALGFELLFVDGQVRVRPDLCPTMP